MSGRLRAWLNNPTLVIHHPTGKADSLSLVRAANDLTHNLEQLRNRRVALTSARADHILIALAAAEASGCELVLLRDRAVDEDRAAALSLGAVIDGSLGLRKLDNEAEQPDSREFRILIATSGTTGQPKLARHSIDALLGRVRPSEHKQSTAKWLLTYHPATFGGLQVLLTALAAGDEIVAVAEPSLSLLCEAALQSLPTHISGTPTFWRSFLPMLGERVIKLDFRQITLGGEIADTQVLERLRTAFPNASISHIYASTEAGSLFSVRDGKAGFPAIWLETGIDGVGLRIVDGVLQIKSPRSMSCYVGGETSTVQTEDGWLISGDLVEQAGDRIFFQGRQDLMLNIGGAKVRPEEVEEALLKLPEVADARVFGAPNPITGFVVAADIVLCRGLEATEARPAILAQLRASLAAYKVPRVVKFVPQISISASGKKIKSQ